METRGGGIGEFKRRKKRKGEIVFDNPLDKIKEASTEGLQKVGFALGARLGF